MLKTREDQIKADKLRKQKDVKVCVWIRGSHDPKTNEPMMPYNCRAKSCKGYFLDRSPLCSAYVELDALKKLTNKEQDRDR